MDMHPPPFPPEAEFKEFEPRHKFKQWLKYGEFYWKSYSMFQDLNRRLIETGFVGFETRLKIIKFRLSSGCWLNV